MPREVTLICETDIGGREHGRGPFVHQSPRLLDTHMHLVRVRRKPDLHGEDTRKVKAAQPRDRSEAVRTC